MRIREYPVEEKPREKLLSMGADSLSNAELLAILLGSGTSRKSAVQMAEEVLTLGEEGIRHLADCTPEELCCINGMGQAKCCSVLAAVELGKRIATAVPEKRFSIKSSEDVAGLYMERLRYEKRENFMCLLINVKGEIIEDSVISVGDLCSSITHPREVFTKAVRRSAGSVIFVHNHPSGDPEPSATDIETTERLAEAGNLLGIPVLDHIIIGDGNYTSLKSMGVL
ncbi:MAG: DNA repair protein RadC [Firmicutes bacterium]|nr:DNA repair protein RadC [Bacillota bacterium]